MATARQPMGWFGNVNWATSRDQGTRQAIEGRSVLLLYHNSHVLLILTSIGTITF
jgi:hypothetical protein